MVNENKVKMLTKLSGFEKKIHGTSKDILNFSKVRYMAKGIWWTFCAATVAFISVLVIYSLSQNNTALIFSDFLEGETYMFTNIRLWIEYLIFISAFVVIAVVFYGRKYSKLAPQLDEYKRRKNNYDDFYNRRDSRES